MELIKGHGGIADVMYLKKFLIHNMGDLDLCRAYQRSGLHINIAVAPTMRHKPAYPQCLDCAECFGLECGDGLLCGSCSVSTVHLTSKP